MYRIPFIPFLVFLASGNILHAQNSFQLYQPNRSEILDRYKKSQWCDSVVKNTILNGTVNAHWQKGGNAFWYVNLLKDSLREYIYVDALHGKKSRAFDSDKMIDALTKSGAKIRKPHRLILDSLVFSNDGRRVDLKSDSTYYECDLNSYGCKIISALPPDTMHYPGFRDRWPWWGSFATDSISPDKKWAAFIKKGNLFIQSTSDSMPIQYTQDGTEVDPYGSLAWSPDSKYIVGYKIHPIKDSMVYHVLSSVPNTTRGQLKSEEYKQPGDSFTTYQMHIFTLSTHQGIKVNVPIRDFHDAPKLNWRTDPRYFLYEQTDRGHQRFRIFEVNAHTGESRTIVEEKTNTFIYEFYQITSYLPATNEIIMSSEKDGWQHLYLINSQTGEQKLQITKGNWVVRSLDSVDTKKREIWFTASGMNPDENAYNIHFYRIGMDGKNLVKLTTAMAQHSVRFSPNKKFYIDSYSRVNQPWVSELHQVSDGKKIMDLEQEDISAFSALGFKAPEPFIAKARDGKTDIYGIVCKPYDFDSSKRYPVIENIYAGPQDSYVPTSYAVYSEMQSIAQLGFIVVMIDGMGTANRSKAFHDVCWHNLADAGLPDRILWIKALAAKYPYVDTTRVGVYGTSAGGQNSTGALLFHPEFYKAAVSSCGCHDNRIDKQWWNEQWMGYPIGPHYAEQSNITNAAKLKGRLFLIVGEDDNNVPPESTYRLADALIKAGKVFDFLTIPGADHTDGGPYGRLKRKDFFVRALLGVEPPDRNNN